METTTLDQEKFEGLKELAEIQENISLGRAEILKLKETTEEYMVVREQEAEERVIKVLKESREFLDKTTRNQEQLSRYNTELREYAQELAQIAKAISTLFKDFNTRMREADNDVKEYFDSFNELKKRIKLDKLNIQEDRKQLERQRVEIRDAWRLLRDRQETLEKGFVELKKLKAKRN